MRVKTFKKSIILLAFEKTGLILYNPEKVLSPLREKMQKRSISIFTPSPFSSRSTESTWPTPQNIPELHDYAAHMCNTLEYINDSSSFRK